MEHLLSALRAAGEATRLRIIALLSKGELTVGELVQILGQSQPRVSRHLKLMGESGLLDRVQEGTQVFYRLRRVGVGGALNGSVSALIADSSGFPGDFDKLEAIRQERAAVAQAYFRANAKDWDRIRSLHVSDRAVEQAMLERFRAVQGDGPIRSLLDIGTGTGRMLEVFGPIAEEAIGIDVSRDMLAIARTALTQAELGHCQVRLGNMYELDLPDRSQHLVIIHQVLHFADDPAQAVKEAARVLAPAGQMLIVDFAPHDQEFLRIEQAHRRLGFAEEEVNAFGQAVELHIYPLTKIDGGRLRVNIWHFQKMD